MKRRNFIKNTSLAGMGLSLFNISAKNIYLVDNFISNRPTLNKRTFTSEAVEDLIVFIKNQIEDKELSWMFENCYPNTIDTTVDYEIIDGKPDTFIITGDIDAMWLRDSTAQVWPYLPLIKKGYIVASSDGLNIEHIIPFGLKGLPVPENTGASTIAVPFLMKV